MIEMLQRIVYEDRLVAVVMGEEAMIDDCVTPAELRFVQAMCLYALEVAERARPAPYSEKAAAAYARRALAQAQA